MSGLPLAGLRILVTRPRHQVPSLRTELTRLGARVVEVPLIEIVPPDDWTKVDRSLRTLSSYDWLVITSANAIDSLAARAARIEVTLRGHRSLRVAAIGRSTAQALERHGLHADSIPPRAEAEGIAGGLGELRGRRVLLAQADIARAATAHELRTWGAEVDVVTVYRTVPAIAAGDRLRQELESGVDLIAFMSGSAVAAFVSLGGRESMGDARIACIGDRTAEGLRAVGLRADVVAATQTAQALAEAIARDMGTLA